MFEFKVFYAEYGRSTLREKTERKVASKREPGFCRSRSVLLKIMRALE